MRRKPPAPLIVAFVLQLAVLAMICAPQLRTATYLGLFDSFLRSRSFSTLYQAAQGRDQAYDVVNNHYTPLTILLQSVFTVFSENAAAWIFQILSIAAAAGALILSVRLFFDADTRAAGLDEDRGGWRWIARSCVPMALLSAPLGRCLWMEGPDALVWFLIAAALSLAAAPLTERGDGRPKRGLDYMSGIALALAVAIRPFLIVVILPFIALRRWKVVAGFVGTAALLFLLTERMWIAFVMHERADNDFLFKFIDNSSVSTAVYFVRQAQTLGVNNFPDQSIWIATFIFAAMLFVHVILDVKIGFPRERREQALLVTSYLPFAFAIPLTLDPQFLSVGILLLPYLALLWLRSCNGVQRVGIVTSAAGWAAMHANFQTIDVVNNTYVPFCMAGVGTLTLLAGLAIHKAGELKESLKNAVTVRRPSRPSLSWRVLFPLRFERWIYLGASAVGAALSCGCYARFGFNGFVALIWALSIGFLCAGLWSENERKLPRFRGKDALIGCALTALFAIPYLLYLYEYPVQINTDELSVLDASRLATYALKDWFGLFPAYHFFPSGGFKLLSSLAALFGGVTFQHVRMASAVCGLTCVPAAYFFFRQLYRWKFAALATLLLGANHVLLGLSRMCLRDNVPLFFELVALGILIRGWRRNNFGLTALGGAVAGFGVYSYFSARIIIIIWLAFLVVTGVVTVARSIENGQRRWSNPIWMRAFKAFTAALVAFLISSAPMMIATAQSPPVAMAYPKAQFVLYPEGRQVLREWEATDSTKLAMVRSTLKALTMFNNNISDSVHTYENFGNGFVDPLTGVLLWVGVWRMCRKRRTCLREILTLTGFFTIWLPLSFLMVKNPGFSRFLVILPFVVVLSLEGARVAVLKFSRATMERPTQRTLVALFATAVFAACLWNGWMYYGHVRRGLTEGDVPGNTVRYAAARAATPNYSFYMVMDEIHPYYWFGSTAWPYWIDSFISQDQKVELVDSNLFLNDARPLAYLKLPCTVYMTKELWLKVRVRVRKEIKKVTVTKIIPTAEQLAIELSDGPISR